MEAIKEKYQQLEIEYVKSRDDSKQKIDRYLEQDAGVKLTELHDQLKKLRSHLSDLHPVCNCTTCFSDPHHIWLVMHVSDVKI